MENITIPDDFYIVKIGYEKYLCHKSCTLQVYTFSNKKYICLYPSAHPGNSLSTNINILRNICNMCDEIVENTYFINYKFNNLNLEICQFNYSILLFKKYTEIGKFNNVNDFLEYLTKNYPECIRNNDIKIALKD